MKRMILMAWLLVCAVPFKAGADHEIDWNDWFEGDVQVRLRVDRGEGALYHRGRPVGLKLEANEDAYHLVYAIDTDGYVRLLFPRYWEDDGWLFAHEELRLQAHHLAWPAHRWGPGGIVYVEAVASPVPFDFSALGVVFEAGRAGWYQRGRPLRISGDPFLAFNDVHQMLFPDWEQAVFAVDYTYFHVDHVGVAPRYLGYSYQRVYVPPPTPSFSVGLRFVWHWEFGRRYCRPVYRRYYVPGRHVVHHHVYRHHHVVYTSPAPRPLRRGGHIPWVAPARKRIVHDVPTLRQRERPAVQPRPDRERKRADVPRLQRPQRAQHVSEASRRAVQRQREAPARRIVERSRPESLGSRRAAVPAAKRVETVKDRPVQERLLRAREAKPRQAVEKRAGRSGKQRTVEKAKPRQHRQEAQEKKRRR